MWTFTIDRNIYLWFIFLFEMQRWIFRADQEVWFKWNKIVKQDFKKQMRLAFFDGFIHITLIFVWLHQEKQCLFIDNVRPLHRMQPHGVWKTKNDVDTPKLWVHFSVWLLSLGYSKSMSVCLSNKPLTPGHFENNVGINVQSDELTHQ